MNLFRKDLELLPPEPKENELAQRQKFMISKAQLIEMNIKTRGDMDTRFQTYFLFFNNRMTSSKQQLSSALLNAANPSIGRYYSFFLSQFGLVLSIFSYDLIACRYIFK